MWTQPAHHAVPSVRGHSERIRRMIKLSKAFLCRGSIRRMMYMERPIMAAQTGHPRCSLLTRNSQLIYQEAFYAGHETR
jgi:hypothetical protein